MGQTYFHMFRAHSREICIYFLKHDHRPLPTLHLNSSSQLKSDDSSFLSLTESDPLNNQRRTRLCHTSTAIIHHESCTARVACFAHSKNCRSQQDLCRRPKLQVTTKFGRDRPAVSVLLTFLVSLTLFPRQFRLSHFLRHTHSFLINDIQGQPVRMS